MMRSLRVRRVLLGLAALAVPLSACSSNAHNTSSSSTSSTSTGQSAAATRADITTVWQTFFSPRGTASEVQGMNPQLAAVYQRAKSTVLPPNLTAVVTNIVLLSSSDCTSNAVPAPCAKVTYNLLIGGAAKLTASTGYAAEVGGQWLVAKSTICSLLLLGNGGHLPPGC